MSSHVCQGVLQHEDGVGRMVIPICFWYGMSNYFFSMALVNCIVYCMIQEK